MGSDWKMRKSIFVVTPSVVIKKDGNALIFELKGKRERLPIGVVEHLFLFVGIEITTKALRFLLSNGRYVFYLNSFGKLVDLSVLKLLTSNNGLRALQ
ncbi:CRISPR associated protein Cas1 family [Phorcysia thermohydrogeniphila]|uniref:CRISPR associated protein Cas1 family n=1 Tax=Phorcysia thermohydrogeniphila TaxID=936138 RepID=A0A4R1GGY9_9BACT|nr:CRISPR associated protein Cas1 family [Phorcysia thermohydrogeniphila]